MRINWVMASGYQLDPTVDVEKIKNIGSVWGSWTTWRTCGTDNVICSDFSKAKDLLNRAFQSVCNFYVPSPHYQDLGRPVGVKLYNGQYQEEVDNIEDIVAMHLALSCSDIILLCGFDMSKPIVSDLDQFQKHKIKNRHGLIRGVISSNPNTQWVTIDHDNELDLAYQNLSNLSCDKMENVLNYL